MSYTGLTIRQSTRFTRDIEMFVDFAVENTANDLNVVDAGKHLKNLAVQFVEDYGKTIPNKKMSTKKVIADEDKKAKAALKSAKLAEKQAKHAAEIEQKKLLREEKSLEKAMEKANWMTAKRLTDPNDKNKTFHGTVAKKNGEYPYLRIQKSRIDGTFRKVNHSNWTDEANEVFETHYSMISNTPKSKGPDMSKILEEMNEDETVEKAIVEETIPPETIVEEAIVEDTNSLENDIKTSKAEALKVKAEKKKKKAEMKKKRAEMKKKKEAVLKKQQEAELKKQIVENDITVEDIELDEELDEELDDSSDEEDDMLVDFEHEKWPGKKLKIDDEGGIWDPVGDQLIAMKLEDGSFQEYP